MNLKPLTAALAAAVVAVLGLPGVASASTPAALVSATPIASTPNVLDGEVEAIARIGHTVILGGNFTQVQNHGQSAILNRNDLFTYDETTGKISHTFLPAIGPVGTPSPRSSRPATAPRVPGGPFTTINGTKTGRIARIDVTTGQIDPTSTPRARTPRSTTWP